MNIMMGKTLFNKRASHLVTYEPGSTKSQIIILAKRDHWKFVKDMKVTPSDQYFTQRNLFVCYLSKKNIRSFKCNEKI